MLDSGHQATPPGSLLAALEALKVACSDTLDQMDEAGIDAPLLRESIGRLAHAAKEAERIKGRPREEP